MLIVFGFHRFGSKRVAYRNDYCLSCEEPRVSEHIRSFLVGHLYWVPLLPLGFHRAWRCASCGNHPGVRQRTSRTLVFVLAGLIGLVAALLTGALVVEHTSPQIAAFAGSTLVAWALTGLLVFIGRRMRPLTDRKRALAQIHPASTQACVFCNGRLLPGHGSDGQQAFRCTTCKVERKVA